MPRRKLADVEDDEDYDPYDSFDDTRGRNGGAMIRSSRGRPVKARHYMAESDSEGEEEQPSRGRPPHLQPSRDDLPGGYEYQYRDPPSHSRPKPAKRQRWVPHNPLIMGGGEDDDDSKEPQISDDDDEESGDEGASRARRRAAESRSKAASVPVRDESGKFIGVRPQTPAERRQMQATATGSRGPSSGGIFKTAAVTVLREERRLMSTGEIARIALKRGYIKVQGRTPEATMASAMYTDVKRKEDRSTFIRPHEGLFGLREWLEEGTVYKDPIEDKFPDESRQAVLRRNRISSTQQLSRANSRGSGAGNNMPRSHMSSPAYDPFGHSGPQSQGNSTRGDGYDREGYPELPEIGSRQTEDVSIGLPPRLAAGLAGLDHSKPPAGGGYGGPSSTPFGGSRGGPPPEIFKSRFAESRSSVPTGRRSLSGSQLPAFQSANSGGRKQKRQPLSQQALSQQDSGNMLLLLNAVEDVKSMDRPEAAKRSGLAPRGLGLAAAERRTAMKRANSGGDRSPQLLIQGFNAARLPSVAPAPILHPQAMQTDQVNILNLPLPDLSLEEGDANGAEIIPPGATMDPNGMHLSAALPPANHAPPPGVEAALQALDSAFASAPLPLSSSLSGPLVPAIRIPSGALPLLAAPSDLLPVESPAGPPPATLGLVEPPVSSGVPLAPGPTEQPSQISDYGALPDFGPPESGVKRLAEVEAAVQSMEATLGGSDPKVGKALLYLSRVYQCMATPEYYQKAQRALHHAYEICFACQKPPQ